MNNNDYISMYFGDGQEPIFGNKETILKWFDKDLFSEQTGIKFIDIKGYSISTSTCYDPNENHVISCMEIKFETVILINNKEERYTSYVDHVKNFSYIPEEKLI